MPELARQWCTVHGFTDSRLVINHDGVHIQDLLSADATLGRRIVVQDVEGAAGAHTDSEEAAALGPGRASVFADGSMVVVVAWMAGWDVASPDGTGADGMWVDDDAMEEIDGWA